ncbi:MULTISPECIES: hypothetical protein [Citrobacter]|uniref:hypothetical protein n=1 Tax=Citrobacter TaxID=544 RepID=UPI00214DA7F4|nr:MULTISPECIES: hypothetical protein [Citrobacter]MCR3694202.1 hypothetical protein [Citrobacter portucalensis]MDM2755660.1 hypothetical protein [Citrobacter sp. Cpo221]MDM2901978.1 hypothetical protein [Citrobacter sp. Cpo037]
MTALNKQALRVPERKRRDWSQAVMRDCDFCSQWALTVKHDDGGHICASCCDAEYTSELKCALESAIDRAEAADKRIAELESRTVTLPKALNSYAGVKIYRPNDVIEAIRAAGIGVKGE